ncbi:MAG: L-seryl-tRNA(Sec) selenium transferase [Betaproteobacteria bacterium]|nr:MAG: L-seryl-tRNA(Sec) selenium transferase [Betaproteobacteria bacterium]
MSFDPLNPRSIPSVDRLLAHCPAEIDQFGRSLVTEFMRDLLDDVRSGAHPDVFDSARFDNSHFIALLRERLGSACANSQRRVLNLTGTVLHTNLGRAVLPAEAANAVAEAMTWATNLEYDLDRGSRGERDDHVAHWLTRLTGAEAATVVNNNAAAVLLVLGTLAARKEVIVSRGELVEIGGAFRIPDIMSRAGCRLVEVGTTNRTHLRDYADAIGPRTAALMKVHTSNYAIQGFTAQVAEDKLAELAKARELPFIVDLGSGMLVDLERWGLPHEPTVRETLLHGADVVTFSGDKLLGGPQAGMIAGRRDLIARINRNPLKRALRVDKLRLAALEAVLRLYTDPDRLRTRLPTLAWLTRPRDEIEQVARLVLGPLTSALRDHAEVRQVECRSQIGSGSLPVDLLPSVGVSMRPLDGGRRSGRHVERLDAAFRKLPIPVIGRIQEGALHFDLRTLNDPGVLIDQLAQLELGAVATKAARAPLQPQSVVAS